MHLVYEGLSELSGDPVVALITGIEYPSRNEKTGPMAQLWILHRDVPPIEARRSGKDEAICGDCKLRNGACYVQVQQAPTSIWKAYKKSGAVQVTPEDMAVILNATRRSLRVGAYGDPAAVPSQIWTRLLTTYPPVSYTGYTHQWRRDDPVLRNLFMASVDSWDEGMEAQAMGWRTFRIHSDMYELHTSEVVCPASEEGGYKSTCASCLLCGSRRNGKNVTILVHGARNKIVKFTQLDKALHHDDPEETYRPLQVPDLCHRGLGFGPGVDTQGGSRIPRRTPSETGE